MRYSLSLLKRESVELQDLVQQNTSLKLIAPEHLLGHVRVLRDQKKSVATANGSFDLLHSGHLQLLMEGSKQADIFIVALNTDSSIQRYKSPHRPIVSLLYRLQMVAALSCVDYVTWFDEQDPKKILSVIQPDVHVNGAEYGPNCIEADVVKKNGGRLHLVKRVPGLSTSQIIEKIGLLCDFSVPPMRAKV